MIGLFKKRGKPPSVHDKYLHLNISLSYDTARNTVFALAHLICLLEEAAQAVLCEEYSLGAYENRNDLLYEAEKTLKLMRVFRSAMDAVETELK